MVDPSIPANWGWYELDSGIKGCYRLQPDEFSGDFWDDYHDVGLSPQGGWRLCQQQTANITLRGEYRRSQKMGRRW
ncbi:MAG: hypothetical protein CSA42_07775 [Gammaproteobacteria bacterium]|nr:MAG: hypothetical protein CSA42_07775 [Gammaproteobacteria bacterium]